MEDERNAGVGSSVQDGSKENQPLGLASEKISEDASFPDESTSLHHSINCCKDSHTSENSVRTGLLEVVIICLYAGLVSYYPLIQQYIYARLLAYERDSLGELRWMEASNGTTKNSCSNATDSGIEARAQRDSARWLLYIGLANAIPGIFSTLALGAITDFRGRKLGMVIPAVGAIIKVSSTMLVIKLNLPLYVLLICGVVDGCLGSFGMALTAAFAYLADITKSGKQRTWRITLLEALMGVCSSGVSIGLGYFIRSCGFFYPLTLALGLFVFCIPVIVFCLPETVQCRPEVRVISCERLSSSVSLYVKPREGKRRLQLILLLTTYLVTQIVLISKGVIGSLFQMGWPFCWRSVKLGISDAIGTSCQTITMLLLLRPLTNCIHENLVGMMGILSIIGSLLLFGLAVNDVMLFLAPALGFFILMPGAMVKSVMSRLVGPDEQGSLFAGISSIQLLCFTFGTSAFNSLYAATVSSFPGLVFLVMAGIVLVALLLLTWVEILRRRDKRILGYQTISQEPDTDFVN